MRLLPRHRLHELHKSLLPRHIIDFFELWIDRRWPKIPVSIAVESNLNLARLAWARSLSPWIKAALASIA
jgi:hypothetical protein